MNLMDSKAPEKLCQEFKPGSKELYIIFHAISYRFSI